MSVHQITPLPIVVPLLTGAAIVITSSAPRRVHDLLAAAAALAMVVMCAVLLGQAAHGPIVEWLGGWHPHHGVALGIALVVDPLGAGAALLVSSLLLASIVYSWAYFDQLDGLVYALVLVLGAAMVGLCFTGDLFTMIVFFVLMTVPAVGLTAVENEHRGPLQGALNFAVLNSIAGFAALIGAALTYGRTGALNLAQIGMSLDHHPPDALVAVALTLLLVALLTKAGAVPFHFWLPDAHPVAPTPTSALFSGAMVMTVLFGVARLLATAFHDPVAAHSGSVRVVLVTVGVATAVIGAAGCVEQLHLKRLLAFVTVSQVGIVLCGIALLRDRALAGAALTAVGAGLALAALFGVVGVLMRRFGTTDELELFGCGRPHRAGAAVYAVAALALVPLPPGIAFFGTGLIADDARAVGYGWLPVVLAICSAVSCAALARAGARVFLGLGPRERLRPTGEQRARQQKSAAPILVVIPALLVIASFGLGLVPGFVDSVQAAAVHFRNFGLYKAAVLGRGSQRYGAVATLGIGAGAWIYALASLALALALAAFPLRGRRVIPAAVVDVLRGVHSGHVGDYVAWWTFGLAILGVALWAVAG
jgi:multicomponent Na+:H+ antiporter subunit D